MTAQQKRLILECALSSGIVDIQKHPGWLLEHDARLAGVSHEDACELLVDWVVETITGDRITFEDDEDDVLTFEPVEEVAS